MSHCVWAAVVAGSVLLLTALAGAGAASAAAVPQRTTAAVASVSVAGAVQDVLPMAMAVHSGRTARAGSAPVVLADATLPQVLDNVRNWIVGMLAGLATVFLTIGGLRYLMAGGDPSEVEKAKIALKSAAIGYALAVLAPVLVSILQTLVGAA